MNKRFYIFIVFFCISINIFAQEHKNALLIANEIYETSEKEQKLKSAQNQNLDENSGTNVIFYCPEIDS